MVWRLEHPLRGVLPGVCLLLFAPFALAFVGEVGVFELGVVLVVSAVVAVIAGGGRRRGPHTARRR